jgi:hypothetical protein
MLICRLLYYWIRPIPTKSSFSTIDSFDFFK